MRKIHITESQWKTILEAESTYPLNVKDDDGCPDNFTEYEVAVNNTDNDAPDSLTIADKISKNRSKEGWFGMNRYPAMHRLPESRELDNMQNSGYGMKGDAYINGSAKTNGGKMVSNIAGEINSDTRGSRNNTNEVRIKRMEDYKTSNPELFAKNGGEQTLNILKAQTDRQSGTHKEKHSTDLRKSDTTPGISNTTNGAYYFK